MQIRRTHLIAAFSAAAAASFLVVELQSQPRAGNKLEPYARRSRESEAAGLREPFKGITARARWNGHHLIVNYFVLGGQVVMMPVFLGSVPVIATSGKFKGTAIPQDDPAKGLEMVYAQRDAQRAKAIFRGEKTGDDDLTEACEDNVAMDYQGARGSELDAKQKRN